MYCFQQTFEMPCHLTYQKDLQIKIYIDLKFYIDIAINSHLISEKSDDELHPINEKNNEKIVDIFHVIPLTVNDDKKFHIDFKIYIDITIQNRQMNYEFCPINFGNNVMFLF